MAMGTPFAFQPFADSSSEDDAPPVPDDMNDDEDWEAGEEDWEGGSAAEGFGSPAHELPVAAASDRPPEPATARPEELEVSRFDFEEEQCTGAGAAISSLYNIVSACHRCIEMALFALFVAIVGLYCAALLREATQGPPAAEAPDALTDTLWGLVARLPSADQPLSALQAYMASPPGDTSREDGIKELEINLLSSLSSGGQGIYDSVSSFSSGGCVLREANLTRAQRALYDNLAAADPKRVPETVLQRCVEGALPRSGSMTTAMLSGIAMDHALWPFNEDAPRSSNGKVHAWLSVWSTSWHPTEGYSACAVVSGVDLLPPRAGAEQPGRGQGGSPFGHVGDLEAKPAFNVLQRMIEIEAAALRRTAPSQASDVPRWIHTVEKWAKHVWAKVSHAFRPKPKPGPPPPQEPEQGARGWLPPSMLAWAARAGGALKGVAGSVEAAAEGARRAGEAWFKPQSSADEL